VKVVGVTCSAKTALLAAVENGGVIPIDVQKIDVGYQYEASREFVATQREVERGIAQVQPDLVVLLKPELMVRWTYDAVAPRVALETLVRLAAVAGDIPIDVLSRPTVRLALRATSRRRGLLLTCLPASPSRSGRTGPLVAMSQPSLRSLGRLASDSTTRRAQGKGDLPDPRPAHERTRR
jgi:hypothetical protein